MLLHFPTKQIIYSGQTLSLTTDNPKERPLPHYGLLEMQWILQRVTAMSAATNIYDDFDDDPTVLRNEWVSTKKMNWIDTWEMMIRIHTRKKAHRCWLINLLHCLRRVNLLCHLSKGATFDSITFLCSLEMFVTIHLENADRSMDKTYYTRIRVYFQHSP
jgi:hypothetical protein